MGTRNLIAVFYDGEYRIAQYCQWDGYPEGQGMGCLKFLREHVDEQKFKDALKKLRWVNEEKLSRIFQDYGGDTEGFIDCKNSDRFKKAFPEFSRDTGSDILAMVQNGDTTTNTVQNTLHFAADSWCEWCYVIDYDKRTFEVYCGYNTTPLTPDDRFYNLREYEDDSGYHAVKLIKTFDLDNLPTEQEFIDTFKE